MLRFKVTLAIFGASASVGSHLDEREFFVNGTQVGAQVTAEAERIRADVALDLDVPPENVLLVPMAGDYVLLDVVDEVAGGVIGVIKVFCREAE